MIFIQEKKRNSTYSSTKKRRVRNVNLEENYNLNTIKYRFFDSIINCQKKKKR